MSFVLEPADNAALGDILAGQYVTVSLPEAGQSSARQRCYSVSGRFGERAIRITVRKIGKGGLSDSLHDQVSVGSTVLVGPPKGRFVMGEPPERPVVLISVGVGITPLLPMLGQLAKGSPSHDVWFVHGARSGDHHALKEEAAGHAASCERVRLFTAYSRPTDRDVAGRDYDACGRIDVNMIAGLADVATADFYICGPEAFMSTVADDLIARGADPASIRREIFTASTMGASVKPAHAGTSSVPDRTVRFSKSGRSVRWGLESGSLLDLALANGLEVPHSCKVGECQSCLQRLVRGQVQYPDDADFALDADQVLLCQAWPTEDVVIEI